MLITGSKYLEYISTIRIIHDDSIYPFPHCTFDVAHLTAELQISPPQKDDIMQNEDDSDDVTGADL
jgi:hypothetical protein